jgi:hypothetical protein
MEATLSCTADEAERDYSLALELEQKGDNVRAVKYFRKSAKRGHTVAQNNLGVCNLTLKSDSAKAMKWFKRAAEQGNPSACFNLGLCYETVKKDGQAAVQWYVKAAEKGDSDAQNRLGLCYDNGTNGVKQSDALALAWYAQAAAQGNADGISNLKALQDEITATSQNSDSATPETDDSGSELDTEQAVADAMKMTTLPPIRSSASLVPLLTHRTVTALRRSEQHMDVESAAHAHNDAHNWVRREVHTECPWSGSSEHGRPGRRTLQRATKRSRGSPLGLRSSGNNDSSSGDIVALAAANSPDDDVVSTSPHKPSTPRQKVGEVSPRASQHTPPGKLPALRGSIRSLIKSNP